ncbi:MAG: hypothetical protein ACFFDT_09340 [Candidatus Hodarchaeota archaeon]
MWLIKMIESEETTTSKADYPQFFTVFIIASVLIIRKKRRKY